LHVMSVALVSPKAFNRMLVPRIYLTVCWAAAGVVTAFWSVASPDPEGWLPWIVGSGVALSGLSVLALGERDTWSRRVRRTIPRSPLLRLPAFLFYTGSAGGLLWCTLLFAATLGVGYACAPATSVRYRMNTFDEVVGNLVLYYGYVLCYCLTTAFLRTTVLKNVPTIYLPITALLLAAVLATAPYLMAFFFTDRVRGPEDLTAFLLGSPMVLSWMNRGIGDAVPPFVIGWTALGVVVSLRWFAGQWRRFAPYRAEGDVGIGDEGLGMG
jgi:hypothetical protein